MEVKIKLHSWIGSKTYMIAEKFTVLNHRNKERVKYKVIERHTFSSSEEIITDTYKGLVYEYSDVIEINQKNNAIIKIK